MHRRRIDVPNGRQNRGDPRVVVPANVPQQYEATQPWWRYIVLPVLLTLFILSLFIIMKLDAEASKAAKLSSSGHRPRHRTQKVVTAAVRRVQDDHEYNLSSLYPIELIWRENRAPPAVDDVANTNQIETLLKRYAFTMATRAYWALDDILSTDVTWTVINHRKRSTPRIVRGRREVRTELEALYRPYITGHRQNISRIELLHNNRGRALTEFEINVAESSTPEDGYKGRSAVGRYVDELVWTNTSQWQIQERTVEYTGECRCDPDIAHCPPGCPDSLLGPASFDDAANQIPLQTIYLAYAHQKSSPAAGPIPLSWSAAETDTVGSVKYLGYTLTKAGLFNNIYHEYQAIAYKRDSTGALVVYLSKKKAHAHGHLKEPSENAGVQYDSMSAVTMLFLSHSDAKSHPYRPAITFGMQFDRDGSLYAYVNGPHLEKLDQTKILTIEDVFGSVGAMAGLRLCSTCF